MATLLYEGEDYPLKAMFSIYPIWFRSLLG
jgi:hypothetical protein